MIETRWQRQKRVERWTGKRAADLDAEELERAKIGGYEPGPDGYMVLYRDKSPVGVSALLGHRMTPAKLRLAQAAMAKRDTKVSDLCAELGVTRQTLYRFVGPKGELRADATKLLNRKAQNVSS
jgi:hypothetical protein